MKRTSNRSLLIKLASHLAMGGLLGLGLAASLFLVNARHVLKMISNSSAPLLTAMVLVSTFTLICAIDAIITGFIFIQDEQA